MAHLECCHETETAIFATHTNLPVLDFSNMASYDLNSIQSPFSMESHEMHRSSEPISVLRRHTPGVFHFIGFLTIW